MFKVKNFDYDLWTTDDGKKFARVRRTSEVCEVDEETMKLLRSAEKRAYRELELQGNLDSDDPDERLKASIRYPCSFEVADDENDEESVLLASGQDLEAEIIAKQMEEDFISTLTAYQKEIYICVIRNKESQASFAQRKGVKKQSINENVALIRKKAKIFWK